MNKVINQYLDKYAAKETVSLNGIYDNNHIYDFVVIIPIYNESYDCLTTIFSKISQTTQLLVVIVVNQPDEIKTVANDLNSHFIFQLKDNPINNVKLNENCSLLTYSDFFDVLLVDRTSKNLRIPQKKGVGLARKVGCDIALSLFNKNTIKSPWLFSIDADVTLPKNYFNSCIKHNNKYSALVFEFKHFSDNDKLSNLQFYYDLKLYYYLSGVVFAKTGYEYIPLGSTLVVDMLSYAQVRGFPQKNAGEDFYILNKLAKVKPILYEVDDNKILIKSRFSDRVPFGTGPALNQLKTLESIEDNPYYYHPMCFILLKSWIKYLKQLYHHNELHICVPDQGELYEIWEFFGCSITFDKVKKQITNQKNWEKFIFQWFDAFRVLKTIHFFEKKYSKLNYLQLLNNDSFAKVKNSKLIQFLNSYD